MILFLVSSVTMLAQDVQVAFDSTNRVYVIDAAFNSEHQIITGFDDFVEARLFMSADSSYSLEVVTEKNGVRGRTTRRLTVSDVQSIRNRMAVLPFDDLPHGEHTFSGGGLDQSGRTSLLLGSTLWSLLYYGTATSMALDVNEPAVPILLAGGLGYLVPALLTNNAQVTDGAASLALGGMFQGTIHGWALASLLAGDDLFNQDTPRLGFGLSVLTGIGETVAGYLVATNTNMSEGRASVLNTSAFYGMVCGGLATAAVFDQVEPSSDVAARTVGGLALVGAAAGVIVGNTVANGQHYSTGDASMYSISGLFGATLPWVVLATIAPEQSSFTVVSTLSIATTIGGLWLGDHLVRGKDYRASDGTIASLSVLGGALIGVGVSMIADNSSAAAILTYAGALGGFAVSLAMAKPTRETKSTSSLEFNINPMGPFILQRDAYGLVRPSPFAAVRYRF